MEDKLNKLQKFLAELNREIAELGLPEIQVVRPEDCLPQDKNARYFTPETFNLLVENIKADKRLESVPLVYRDLKIAGKYRIISGHHRIDGAKQAKIEYILVIVIKPASKDEIISKQLAHNSIVGKDDRVILDELFKRIEKIKYKIASGVSDKTEKISYVSINFRIGEHKELLLLFLPEDFDKFDETLTSLENWSASNKADIKIASLEIFDRFANALRTIKKTENIKNNATGIMRMVEIVEQYLESQKEGERDGKK